MINIHKSSKGTSYVWASELKEQLEIQRNIEDWMKENIDYGFQLNEDYSIHTFKHDGESRTIKDWAIKIDMAKHIALFQKTQRSNALRSYLISVEKKRSEGELLNRKQILALMDLCKVLGLFSVQKYLENEHFHFLNKPKNWWEYRAKLLGFNRADLKEAIRALGIKYKSQRHAILMLDKHKIATRFELIKAATIDLFIILGKSQEYAMNMGLTAKELAIELNPEIYNDLYTSIDFKTESQKNTISQIKNRNKEVSLLNNF